MEIYREIFQFSLGIGESFHKSQIITNNYQNINEIKEETFKARNKSQIIKIYNQLATKLFKQIYFYNYNPRTLVLILKTKKNKLYKRIADKETLFDSYDSIVNTGTKIIEQICNTIPENELLEFNKMTVYFDNIIKLDTIDRNIWEELHENDITEIRIKTNKVCFWNNFLNSKSKEEQKIQSKSVDNNDGNNDIKESEKKKTKKLTSKSINEINKFSKKANLDLLGLNEEPNAIDNEIIENNNYDDNNDSILLNEKYANYPYKIVELINNIREDPVGYADIIEQSIQNIVLEEDKDDPTIKRLIYKKKIKVALTTGEKAFQEAIEYLRTLSPLPPLEFSQEKCIPLPNTEEELNNPSFLKSQVKILREQTRIDVFYKDLIKIPEISGLLMIVDDTNKNAGKKRRALLSNELKYIGVSSKFIGRTFVAYFSFSKE